MPKKYPWQRWPDKDKKKKSSFHGQTSEPSWKKSSLETLRPTAHPKIVRKAMTKNIAEISADGKTIYIDKNVAREDVPAIVAHEKEYWHLRHDHKMSGKDAIRGAVIHEREYVVDHSGDWEAYNLRQAAVGKNISERGSNPIYHAKETYTYHGRTGRPMIHQSESGKGYIMVRAKGGGTKRLYLTEKNKRLLESKQGYPR